MLGPLLLEPVPHNFARQEVLNGILDALRMGCAWRELPHDLPPWDTVYGYFRRWTTEGICEWNRFACFGLILVVSLRSLSCVSPL